MPERYTGGDRRGIHRAGRLRRSVDQEANVRLMSSARCAFGSAESSPMLKKQRVAGSLQSCLFDPMFAIATLNFPVPVPSAAVLIVLILSSAQSAAPTSPSLVDAHSLIPSVKP